MAVAGVLVWMLQTMVGKRVLPLHCQSSTRFWDCCRVWYVEWCGCRGPPCRGSCYWQLWWLLSVLFAVDLLVVVVEVQAAAAVAALHALVFGRLSTSCCQRWIFVHTNRTWHLVATHCCQLLVGCRLLFSSLLRSGLVGHTCSTLGLVPFLCPCHCLLPSSFLFVCCILCCRTACSLGRCVLFLFLVARSLFLYILCNSAFLRCLSFLCLCSSLCAFLFLCWWHWCPLVLSLLQSVWLRCWSCFVVVWWMPLCSCSTPWWCSWSRCMLVWILHSVGGAVVVVLWSRWIELQFLTWSGNCVLLSRSYLLSSNSQLESDSSKLLVSNVGFTSFVR